MERMLISNTSECKQIKSSNNPCLELYLNRIQHDLLQPPTKRLVQNPDNLTKECRKALQDMKKWDNVVIRPFDKGTGFFILDKSEYVDRVKKHLNDTTTFIKIKDKEAAATTATEKITQWTITHRHEKGMTKKIVDWVRPDDNNKPGNNYANLKAHKPQLNYPERLISTGCESYTKHLAAITAYELKKIKLEYVIEDTNHLLRKVDEINDNNLLVGKNVIFVSFDIESMFPSISKNVGLEQCKYHLDRRSMEEQMFSTQCIIDALEITLENNLTEFNSIMYKQCKGTAMGPENACQYAGVTIDCIDQKVMNEYKLKPLVWARYRDDIFVIWQHGLEELQMFHDWLNTLLPGINFTMSEPSSYGIEFLDTFIYYNNFQLCTKIYSKPCDTHSYLCPSSCHPLHSIENIPYNTALRIYKISSEPSEHEKSKSEYTNHLLARGYNPACIAEAFTRVEGRARESLYSIKTEKIDNNKGRVFPLISDFNPALPNVSNVLNKYKSIINLDQELAQVIKPQNIFASFRRPKTIKDLLIHSKLDKVEKNGGNGEVDQVGTATGVCKPCAKSCVLCRYYLKESRYFKSYHCNKTFPICHEIDCETENVIYMINDIICKRSYVGCTTTSTRLRFSNHKSHLKKLRRTCELSGHFSMNQFIHKLDRQPKTNKEFDLDLQKHLEIIIIEEVDVKDVKNNIERFKICQEREGYWQHELRTLAIHGGLNKRDEFKK